MNNVFRVSVCSILLVVALVITTSAQERVTPAEGVSRLNLKVNESVVIPAETEGNRLSYTLYFIITKEGAPLLVTREDQAAYRRLSTASEREQFFIDFWNRRGNEAKREFDNRLSYVDQAYGSNNSRGWETDRGRTYVIYGPPNETRYEKGKEIWLYRSAGNGEMTFVF